MKWSQLPKDFTLSEINKKHFLDKNESGRVMSEIYLKEASLFDEQGH